MVANIAAAMVLDQPLKGSLGAVQIQAVSWIRKGQPAALHNGSIPCNHKVIMECPDGYMSRRMPGRIHNLAAAPM